MMNLEVQDTSGKIFRLIDIKYDQDMGPMGVIVSEHGSMNWLRIYNLKVTKDQLAILCEGP
jgi:hypothetical protein